MVVLGTDHYGEKRIYLNLSITLKASFYGAGVGATEVFEISAATFASLSEIAAVVSLCSG